ncbi:hypothetical protein [Brevibacterium yomogidense]|uniref:hypothetical protein n=1 Tax=Brevibacterium yomogidense TaxID=946573 RepID=UPI0018DFE8A3|nr:hypothetical protein [Brevibacterium yomogidense]
MNSSPGRLPVGPPRPPRPRRGASPLRDFPVVVWLLLAVVAAFIQPVLRESTWVMVHLALLGAMTHAVLVWSTFFAQALLKTPESVDPAAHQTVRLAVLVVGVACVVVGVPSGLWSLVVVGAVIVGAAVAWHGVAMARRLRVALPSRFAVTVRYYLAAAVCLPVGAVFGVLLARWPASDLFGRLLIAHTLTMLVGWLGLTVMGTLVTFWPTMLRTRVDPRAAGLAHQALPVVLTGLGLIIVGALVGLRGLAVAGMVVHLAGVLWWGRGLIGPLRAAPPRRAPALFATGALAWGLVLLVSLPLHVATAESWGGVAGGYLPITTVAVLGFALQLLTGALSQLIPTVLGGGPAIRMAVDAEFARLLLTRFIVLNAGLLVTLLPVPPDVRRGAIGAAMAAVALLIPLILRGIFVGVRAKRARA